MEWSQCSKLWKQLKRTMRKLKGWRVKLFKVETVNWNSWSWPLWNQDAATPSIVSCPTRWSLSLIFGFLWWSCLSTQITERQGTAMYYTQHSNSTSFFALLVKPTLNSVFNVWKHLSVVEQYPSVRACSAFWKIFFVFRTFSITLDSLDPRPILQLRNEKYCNNGEFPS